MFKLIAPFLAQPKVADWLIQRAMRTPYYHLKNNKGGTYMERYWLFNPYPTDSDGDGRRWGNWIPSIRIHRIMQEDREPHMHDHSCNARTIILRGWYTELRPCEPTPEYNYTDDFYHRKAGNTATLKFGEFHRITQVSPGDVWTLFIIWRKRGTWGFRVGDKKIPWREYFGIEKET